MSNEQYVIETFELTKVYPRKVAVNAASIHVRRGDIYGLIGKNGAGKTTLMKMLLGLTLPTKGSFSINGGTDDEGHVRIGSLIEEPGLYKNCTAEENLLRFALLSGADPAKIPEILEIVGLKDVGNKKAGAFSLGMKQRLGLAIALLNDPEILILDEPMNGLDPSGIKDMRDVITDLNINRGVTFIISSHILDELAKVATVYGIINNGNLIEELTLSDIEEKCSQHLTISTDNNEKAARLIAETYTDVEITIKENGLKVNTVAENSAKIAKLLVDNGLQLFSMTPSRNDFENYFIERLG